MRVGVAAAKPTPYANPASQPQRVARVDAGCHHAHSCPHLRPHRSSTPRTASYGYQPGHRRAARHVSHAKRGPYTSAFPRPLSNPHHRVAFDLPHRSTNPSPQHDVAHHVDPHEPHIGPNRRAHEPHVHPHHQPHQPNRRSHRLPHCFPAHEDGAAARGASVGGSSARQRNHPRPGAGSAVGQSRQRHHSVTHRGSAHLLSAHRGSYPGPSILLQSAQHFHPVRSN
mmetsp:Transcript_10368/g.19662  ORF Transcript_10368/g.19662 Transcript_10368/m.19662 type:complete len:226 (-) Transcript_10368:703-1380(-)